MGPGTKLSLYGQISSAQRRLARILDTFWAWLVWFLSKLLTPFHELKNLIPPQRYTKKEGTDAPKDPPVIPKVVPPTPSNDKPEKCRHKDDPWWKTAAEMLGIAAVIAYTIFSGFQMHYARQQRDAASVSATAATQSLDEIKKQFRIDQRPWLYVEVKGPDPKEGLELAWDVEIKNGGKTAGKQSIAQFRPLILKNDETISFSYSGVPFGVTSFIAPQAPTDYPTYIPSAGSQKPGIFTKQIVRDLLHGNFYFMVYGKGTYKDFFGNEYWFRYCNWKSYNPDVPFFKARPCTEYNDTGEGSLPPD